MLKQYSFPRQVRLHHQREIELIFQRGVYQRLGLMHVRYLPTEIGYSRFVISIKKQMGTAPLRNLARRQIKEAIRLNRPTLLGSFDVCFFITRKPQYPVSFSYFEARVTEVFRLLNQEFNQSQASTPTS